jgi:chromosome segregation ATPase
MKKILGFVFVLSVVSPLVVFSAPLSSPEIQQAQTKVWNLQEELSDARYALVSLKLNAEKTRLESVIQKLSNLHQDQKAADMKAKLAELDQRLGKEKTRMQLNHQIVKSERSGDRDAADSLRKELQNLH